MQGVYNHLEGNQNSGARASVAIHASSGNSPSKDQSGSEDERSSVTEDAKSLDQGLSYLGSSNDLVVGMVLCKYNSPLLPPLLAMLAACPGPDAPASSAPEAEPTDNSEASLSADKPCPPASSAAASASEVHTMPISTLSSSSNAAAERSSTATDKEIKELDTCEATRNTDASNQQEPAQGSTTSEAASQNVSISVQQNWEAPDHTREQRKSSGDGQENKEKSVTTVHFGVNEPVLIINPDGSREYVLLSDEQAARQLALQEAEEQEAAAFAAAKAATYWVSLLSPWKDYYTS